MSSSSSSSSSSPHILVFPFPAQGHILPLLDFLHHLSAHRRPHGCGKNLTITVVVTPKNAQLLDRSPATVQKLILPLPLHPSIPPGAENVKDLPSAALSAALANALSPLRDPILLWARSNPNPPTALLSDFFLGWTSGLASDLGIPRLVFYSSGALVASVFHHLWPRDRAQVVGDGSKSIVVKLPEIPGSPSFPVAHIPSVYLKYREGVPEWECMREGMAANSSSWGTVFNTFEGLEGIYLDHLREEFGHRRIWAVGPILPVGSLEERGGPTSKPSGELLSWLDSCPEGSVLYVSFGSQFKLPRPQAAALAAGLERSGVRFTWCVKESGGVSVVPEGFEERTAGNGVVIRGWAPQVAVLGHKAVGTFLTHCGWNSVLEGLVAGVVLLTWPMEADQFVNARLLVDEVGVGVRVWEGRDSVPDPVELGRIMAESFDDSGPGGSGSRLMRERAAEMRRKARAAAGEGGSSVSALDELLQELCRLDNK